MFAGTIPSSAALATVSLGSLATGFAVLAAAFGAIGLIGITVYNSLQPAVEQIDVFGEGVSDVTENKLKPFIDTMNNMDTSIKKIDWTDKIISQEDVASIQQMASELRDSILNEVDADRNQSLQDIEMLKNLKGVSAETYNEMITSTTQYYDDLTARTQQAEARITQIMQTAANENRTLTEQEVAEIGALQDQMKNDAVTTMSESAQEQELILQRLKYNAKALTAEQAQETLQEAIKNKENLLQEAEDTKVRMMAALDARYSSEEAKQSESYKSQKAAIEQLYNDQVKQAEDGYLSIEERVRAGLGEQENIIDYSTGQIRNKWSVFWENQAAIAKNNWDKFNRNMRSWWSGVETEWNNFWGGLKTYWDNVIEGIGNWMKDIWKTVTGWFDDIKEGWNNFWDGLFRDKNNREAELGKANKSAPASAPASQTATVAAYATGGFVRPGAKFIDPNYFTAGEAGREVIGNYKSRRTVMPLENTSFVNAMYQAVHQAVTDAKGSDEPIQITIQPQVKIGNKDIVQAQEEYEYTSGGSLIRKIR